LNGKTGSAAMTSNSKISSSAERGGLGVGAEKKQFDPRLRGCPMSFY